MFLGAGACEKGYVTLSKFAICCAHLMFSFSLFFFYKWVRARTFKRCTINDLNTFVLVKKGSWGKDELTIICAIDQVNDIHQGQIWCKNTKLSKNGFFSSLWSKIRSKNKKNSFYPRSWVNRLSLSARPIADLTVINANSVNCRFRRQTLIIII